ncbi:MAG: 30S ribosomal protein S18 [Chloroflexi bacterium HGW-Chloroflexi-3]|nr:MAG: 30S ribosomal protein S18 [Chloroflexi bacterium HGW-Chloroflexi-3]
MTNENGQFRRGPGNRRGFTPRPKICQFCSDKEVKINYKDVDLLRRYVMEDGKIRPRRQTGTCAKHQREIAAAVKKARFVALLPFVASMED